MMTATPLSQSELLRVITELVERWGSQNNVAARLGITPQYLSDIRLGRREISDTVAEKLGYERVVSFVKVKDRK
jgi:hypothetical protein